MTIAERIAADPTAPANLGSRARCLLLTDRPAEEVAKELSALTGGWAHVDPARHFWMPRGSESRTEAQIGWTPGFIDEHASELIDWWLAAPRAVDGGRPRRVPNWDVASNADIEGRAGVVLVEAKAHRAELAEGGKSKYEGKSEDGEANHKSIAAAIHEANEGLRAATGVDWKLSRDSHYQLANRFAWAWKIASFGVPVTLVYLGFIQALEMKRHGCELIADENHWDKLVRDYASGVVPGGVWNSTIRVGSGGAQAGLIRPIIKAIRVDMPR